MPIVQANGIDINYEVQGEGEPVVLIPYLAADQACYAFQTADYVKHFTCFTVDLRGAGLSSKPEGICTTELFADDIAAFMQVAGIDRASADAGLPAHSFRAIPRPEFPITGRAARPYLRPVDRAGTGAGVIAADGDQAPPPPRPADYRRRSRSNSSRASDAAVMPSSPGRWRCSLRAVRP